MKIKWCVIGAGGIADRRTIPAILEDPESQLVAVMDRVEPVAKAVGEKYGVPYFTAEEDMLKSTDCDAVYIGTPVMCHYDQAMLALRYGKHVFMEKPITLTPKEYALLLCLVRNRGMVLSREQLLIKCWGYDYGGDSRAVDTHIKRLREKLGSAAGCIKTVIKSGYKLEV